MSSSSLAATTLSRSSDAPATGVDRIRMLIGTGPLERSPSARYGPRESDVLLRLRVSTMTPAIVPFNRRRKYPVHPGTTASARRVVGRPRLRCYDQRVDRLAGIERTAASAEVCAHSSAPGGRSLRKDGTRTGRPGAVPCHGWDRDARCSLSLRQGAWVHPLDASDSVPCPRGNARRCWLDGSRLRPQSGRRRRQLARGRSRRRRDDLGPRRFDEGEDPDLRRPAQLAAEWTCHSGPRCRAPTNGAQHGASYGGTSPSRWVDEKWLFRSRVFPQAAGNEGPLSPLSTAHGSATGASLRRSV